MTTPDSIERIKKHSFVIFRIPSYCYSALNTSSTEEKYSDQASPINLSTTSRESPLLRIPEAAPQVVDNENVDILSQSTSPVSSNNVTPKKKSLRKHAPYRLDKAVRKLTDRLEANREGVQPKSESPPPPKCDSPKREESPDTVNDDATTQNSTENNIPESCPPQPVSSLLQAVSAGGLDPIAFMMLRFSAANQQAKPRKK